MHLTNYFPQKTHELTKQAYLLFLSNNRNGKPLKNQENIIQSPKKHFKV